MRYRINKLLDLLGMEMSKGKYWGSEFFYYEQEQDRLYSGFEVRPKQGPHYAKDAKKFRFLRDVELYLDVMADKYSG
jgi:hypothetical protein